MVKNLALVFGDKDQVNMHQENTMPSAPDIGFFFHRPKYDLAHETTTGIQIPVKTRWSTGA
ncbi:transposase [Escherichia coli]|nr:transposase [Escherichia coli]